MHFSRHRLGLLVTVAAAVAVACSNASGTIGTAAPETTARIATSGGMVLVQGEILAKYQAVDGPDGLLGLPIGEEQPTPDGGRRQLFAGGAIYWSPQSGAHIVRGKIRTSWEYEYGGPAGLLGYPISDQKSIPGGSQAQFQHGSITYTGGQPEVHMQ